MQRLRYVSTGRALFVALVAGWPVLPFAARQSRADDAKTAVAVNNAPAATPVAAKAAPKPPTTAPRSNHKKDNTALRAQRAQARRSEIAIDDQYGPGAASFASSMTFLGRNSGSFGSAGFSNGPFSMSALGGSTAFGGMNGFGSSTGIGSSPGSTSSTATGAGTGSTNPGNTGATGAGSPLGTTSTEAPELNAKVLEFALKNMGQQVGNGQCWELGSEALAYAGAEPVHGVNVFGDEVSLADALPGDILEFYNVRLVGANYWMSLGTPYHTAILYSKSGTKITMLNQNVNHVMRVQTTVIDLADQVSGTLTVYRPAARTSRPDGGR